MTDEPRTSPADELVMCEGCTHELLRTEAVCTADGVYLCAICADCDLREPSFIVRFADQDMADEMFGGYGAEEAAHKYFEAKRTSWTVSLFREIARG